MTPIKRLFVATVMLCVNSMNIFACDVCGSAINATYFGILPQFRQHFAGVRYAGSRFTSSPLPSLFNQTQSDYTETLHRTEFWGRFYPTKRIQLFAFIPYQYNSKNDATAITSVKGLSDVSVIANYIIINTGDSATRTWKNTLSVGGGLKLPTGSFRANESASQQTGTGTVDYLLSAVYTTRYAQWGMNIDANVKLNTASASYHYGDRYASGLRFFYWHKKRSVSLIPNMGVLAEYAAKDMKGEITQRYTGGRGYYGTTGVDVYFRKLALGFSLSHPFDEKLNEGYAKTNNRVTAQVLYLF